MSIRKVSFALGEYYHIYNRGNSKQKIFQDAQDYWRFITLLYTCNSENNFKMFLVQESSERDPYLWERGRQIVSVGAYCLMPNHFHILLTENEEGGISKFMQKLSTAYVMYHNKKYQRIGGLFEGKFKSEHLATDRYLKYIFSYIHLNPIKLVQKDWRGVGIKNKNYTFDYLDGYKYSSYLEYIGVPRKQNSILDRKPYPNYFPSVKGFKDEISEWINYNDPLE
jgi:putative transposase